MSAHSRGRGDVVVANPFTRSSAHSRVKHAELYPATDSHGFDGARIRNRIPLAGPFLTSRGQVFPGKKSGRRSRGWSAGAPERSNRRAYNNGTTRWTGVARTRPTLRGIEAAALSAIISTPSIVINNSDRGNKARQTCAETLNRRPSSEKPINVAVQRYHSPAYRDV